MIKHLFLLSFCIHTAFCFGQAQDPLPSWNEGCVKRAIIQFVSDTTRPESKYCVNLEDRIVVFDQDGTLWVEQPLYTQLNFAFDQIKALASTHPEWKNREPYQAIIDDNFEKIKKFPVQDIEKIIAATHANMTVEEFKVCVEKWLENAVHPRFQKSYTKLIYKPMLEVIQYFKSHGYKAYIVSGGGQEFIRVYSEKVYGIPAEQIIGSTWRVKYEYQDGKPSLMMLPEVLFISDKTGKPEAINLIIGKKPVAAFGNSDGDRQMLEWSESSNGKSFQLLVHHDDPIREYQYDVDSKIGTFSLVLKEEALKKGWHIVSMKNDWKVIFSDDRPSE